ncbi:hypothetical protein J1614_000435 [Plenodomus biglobosus]|nr:hypothetical protein J1614_000435 [Plenodomus biglobosus]
MASRLREDDARIQFDMPSSTRPERSAMPSTTYEFITQGRQSPRRDANARSGPRREGARPLYSSNTHLTDQGLVEMRQARALAGLDTGELDIEITRRILHDPRAWGWVGTALAARGWVDDYEASRRLHRVEPEQYPGYLWTPRSRYATAPRGHSARIDALLDLIQ